MHTLLEEARSLVRHPSVALAAVIGIPDELHGEAIKAFVVAVSPSEALAAELEALVRERLAAYEVPSEFESSTICR